MINKLVILLFVVGLVFTAAACSNTNTALYDNKWILESYGQPDNPKVILETTTITATFNKDKGEISGSSGCNSYFGTCEVKGTKLSISEMAHTDMACLSPQGVMEQEQEYLSMLTKAQSFQLTNTALTITCSDEEQLYYTAASE